MAGTVAGDITVDKKTVFDGEYRRHQSYILSRQENNGSITVTGSGSGGSLTRVSELSFTNLKASTYYRVAFSLWSDVNPGNLLYYLWANSTVATTRIIREFRSHTKA